MVFRKSLLFENSLYIKVAYLKYSIIIELFKLFNFFFVCVLIIRIIYSYYIWFKSVEYI